METENSHGFEDSLITNYHLNIPVFILKQVVINGKPVSYVVHDEEDNCQFLTNDEVSSEDLMIITLKEILEIDPSLEEILWMPENMEATRKQVGHEWITKVYSE